MKIVFIADAHLKGIDDPNQERLVKFLDGLTGVDTLVVLGDLLDFWAGLNDVVYYHYRPVLMGLMRLRERGTGLIYIEGNHDFSMGPFFTDTLGAGVHPDSFFLNVDGKRFYLAHGDTVRMKAGYRLWRVFLRSPLFRLITRVAPPGFTWKAANLLSGKSRRYSRGVFIEGGLKEFARKKLLNGADGVILGHSHVPGVQRQEAGKKTGIYANPGSWTDGSYLVYEDGEFRTERVGG